MRHSAKNLRGRLLFVAGLLLAGHPLVPDLTVVRGQGGAALNQAPRMINQPTDPALQRIPVA